MDFLSNLSKFESNLPVSICMGILHHVSGLHSISATPALQRHIRLPPHEGFLSCTKVHRTVCNVSLQQWYFSILGGSD